ncbi:MAG: hypothetical protein MJZ28_10500 [Paludibacteraceae bacterium]|nr:hypothetical protein [Paludibacteraceae bacterium]
MKDTKRTNEVKFFIDKEFAMYFEQEGNIVITEGQPHDLNAVCNWKYDKGTDKNLCTITIDAGRKGSEEVAKSFANEVRQYQTIATDNHDSDRMPDKLNFYVKGKMTIKNIEDDEKEDGEDDKKKDKNDDKKKDKRTDKPFVADVILAQGHNAKGRNNWWFASENMVALNIRFFFDATGLLVMTKDSNTDSNTDSENDSDNQPNQSGMKLDIFGRKVALCIVQEKDVNEFDVNKISRK